MTALPGTPSIQNAIPMATFGTTPFATPVLWIVAALVMLGFGMVWLRLRAHWLAGEEAPTRPEDDGVRAALPRCRSGVLRCRSCRWRW
jgi:H+/gluconate symporter-like permease